MDVSTRSDRSVEQMVVRGKMDEETGDITVPLRQWIDVGEDESLDVALVKMKNPRVHNLTSPQWFQWEIIEEHRDATNPVAFNQVNYERVYAGFVPQGFYPSVTAIINYIVAAPLPLHLPANTAPDVNRQEMIVTVSDLMRVKSTEKLTVLESNWQRGKQLFPHRDNRAKLLLKISHDLVDVVHRVAQVGNRPDRFFFNLFNNDSESFDNMSSYLHEQPLVHLMMAHLQESVLDGEEKPRLYSFPMHQKIQVPKIPRFVPFQVTRQGSVGQVRTLRLWLENERGEKIKDTDETNFNIELIWRKPARSRCLLGSTDP